MFIVSLTLPYTCEFSNQRRHKLFENKFSDYDLTLANRSNLNLIDAKSVKKFFEHRFFDAVIHTATSGGSRLKEDTSDVFYENCIMHQNILDNACSFES